MTKRKTRKEIAAKLSDAKAGSMVAFLDRLEREMGSEVFWSMLITMTCDGGGEFMDAQAIERSCYDGKPRISLYFAHPYSACELGTNENHNRMLRRFFPKGTDFCQISEEEVEKTVVWMNDLLLGCSPNMALKGAL